MHPQNSGEFGGYHGDELLEQNAAHLRAEYPDMADMIDLLMRTAKPEDEKAVHLDRIWAEGFTARLDSGLAEYDTDTLVAPEPVNEADALVMHTVESMPPRLRDRISKVVLGAGSLCVGIVTARMLHRAGAGYPLVTPDHVEYAREASVFTLGSILLLGRKRYFRR